MMAGFFVRILPPEGTSDKARYATGASQGLAPRIPRGKTTTSFTCGGE